MFIVVLCAAIFKASPQAIAQLEMKNQELAQERSAQRGRALKIDGQMLSNETDDTSTVQSVPTTAAELEQAHRQAEVLTLERDKLRREIQCTKLDLTTVNSLITELDKTKVQLEVASLFEEQLHQAMDTIDEQASELVMLRGKLTGSLEEFQPTSAAVAGYVVTDVQVQPPLSLDEELAQAMSGFSIETLPVEVSLWLKGGHCTYGLEGEFFVHLSSIAF